MTVPHPSAPGDPAPDALRETLQALPAALFTWRPDAHGRAEGQWCWLGGALGAELGLVGRQCPSRLLEAGEAARLRACLQAAAEGGTPWRCSLSLGGEDGRTLEFSARPGGGGQALWQGLAVELAGTAPGELQAARRRRQRAEARLGAATSELRSLLDLAPVPAMAWTDQGGIVLWNAAAGRLLGWRAQSALSLEDLIPAAERPAFMAVQQRVLEGAVLGAVPLRLRHHDARTLALRLWLAPLRDLRGNVCGVLALAEDPEAAERAAGRGREQLESLRRELITTVNRRLRGGLKEAMSGLQHEARRRPEAAPALEGALSRLGALAAAHGLQAAAWDEAVELADLAQAVATAVERALGARVPLVLQRTGPGSCRIQPGEAVTVALVLDALAREAVQQAAGGAGGRAVRLTVSESEAGAQLRLFGLASPAQSAAGVQLVERLRALLPATGMELAAERAQGVRELRLMLSAPLLECRTRHPLPPG